MPAGPSEVLVISDEKANPNFVAADILSQAEHGTDSQSVLVCTDKNKYNQIMNKVFEQLGKLPRKKIAVQALENSFGVLVNSLDEAFEFSNLYAPEHLILNLKENSLTDENLQKITNAGSVFVGANTCESFGDYASGTNHVLPTSGFARNFSGVSVDSFIKKITFQTVSDEGVKNLAPVVELLAEKEELFAHKNAATIRRQNLK